MTPTDTARTSSSPAAVAAARARLIALYLPQFHPIPENNRWWGEGFTEWTNVSRCRSLFKGHPQPRVPADLGFYDLRLPEARLAQADLARSYGIEAFCYYHYWFHGQRLIERPFQEVLDRGEPDFPFCMCWANESWSRRWLGEARDILMEQRYSQEDDEAHARWLARAFADRRHIKINGRALFLVYRPKDLPDPKRTCDTIRSVCVKEGLPEPYLVGVNAHSRHRDLRQDGFDDVMDFRPQLGVLPGHLDDGASWQRFKRNAALGVYSASLKLFDANEARAVMEKTRPNYSYIPSVFVGWDNSPRRGENGIIMIRNSPKAFQQELEQRVQAVQSQDPERRIVFINAWNEWAEGNCLEPDLVDGHAWLEAVRAVQTGA